VVPVGGLTVSASEGSSTGPQALATFTDPGAAEGLADYSADIRWGDGGTTTGSLSLSGGVFTVSGNHTYAEEGQYAVVVTVHHDSATDVVVNDTAVVADVPVVALGGVALSLKRGADSGNQVVATFTDPGGAEASAEYSADIAWGDGGTSSGIIGPGVVNGSFAVQGSHTYSHNGSYTVTVTVHHGNTTPASVASTASVTDIGLVGTGGFVFSAVEGKASGAQTVATFTDLSGAEPVSEYSADIAWGDNTTSTGTISFNNGVFSVSGSHVYAEEGPYQIGVAIHHGAGPGATVTSSAGVTDPAVLATGSVSVTAVEGAPVNDQAVATFTDPGGAETPSDYSASISWGDNSTTAGTITGSKGAFTVSGNHRYAEEGFYTITVVVRHDNASDTTAVSSATVSDPQVVATGGFVVNAVEGVAFSGQTLATFTDPGGSEAISSYSADVAWGDGTTSAGVISFNNGVFSVTGSHQYAEEGPYAVSITIHHDTAVAVTVGSSASVTNPSVAATGGLTVTAVVGITSGSQAVATFTDPGGAETVSDYSADISWGDGATTAGTIAVGQSPGLFIVQGDHTYSQDRSYALTVTIHHENAADAVVDSTASVADLASNVKGGFHFSAVEGSESTGQTVATFTDPGGAKPLSQYSADIAWDDGTSSRGTISVEGGIFTVTGSHQYAEERTNYSLTVTVHHVGVKDADALSSATVSDPAVTVTGGFAASAVEGAESNSQTLATFRDPGGAELASEDYSANITWGDGSASAGAITRNGDMFTVSGSHRYVEQGDYAVGVTIHHDSSGDVQVHSSVHVVDPSVVAAGGLVVSAIEGKESGLQTVATFTDPGGAEDVTNYSADISWGDGSTTAATIVPTASPGVFAVTGSHTYAEQGNYKIGVVLHHDQGLDSTAASDTTVADAALTATGVGLQATENGAFSAVVASFQDENPGTHADEYTATIDWGDGQTSAGTIVANNHGGFDVMGSHTYAEDKTFTASVNIMDDGTSTAQASTSVTVVGIDSSLTLSGPNSVDFGATYTLNPSLLQGTNPVKSILIDWGDGTAPTSAVTHNYSTRDPFRYTISATFQDADGTHSATNTVDVVVGGSLFDAVDEQIVTPGNSKPARVNGTVGATLSLSTPGSEATVFVGRYKANPTGQLPNGKAIVYSDINLHFEVIGDPNTTQFSVRFFLPDGIDATKIIPQYFDGSQWKRVKGDQFQIGTDPATGQRFIEVFLGMDTEPTLSQLIHTVFTIAVANPTQTTTLIAPPLALAATANETGQFATTATFVRSSQLTLALTASPERTVSSGGDEVTPAEDRLLRSLQWLLGDVDPDAMPLAPPDVPQSPTPKEQQPQQRSSEPSPAAEPSVAPPQPEQLQSKPPGKSDDLNAIDSVLMEIAPTDGSFSSGADQYCWLLEENSPVENADDVVLGYALAAAAGSCLWEKLSLPEKRNHVLR
jgi:hypothetical protein